MSGVFPRQLSAQMAGHNSVRSDIFIERSATTRSSPMGAASAWRGGKEMSPLRGLRCLVRGGATTMSLLTEFTLARIEWLEVSS